MLYMNAMCFLPYVQGKWCRGNSMKPRNESRHIKWVLAGFTLFSILSRSGGF